MKNFTHFFCLPQIWYQQPLPKGLKRCLHPFQPRSENCDTPLHMFIRDMGRNWVKGKCSYWKHKAVQIHVTVNSGYAVKPPGLPVLAEAWNYTNIAHIRPSIHFCMRSFIRTPLTLKSTSCWQHCCLFISGLCCCHASFWRCNEALMLIFDVWTVSKYPVLLSSGSIRRCEQNHHCLRNRHSPTHRAFQQAGRKQVCVALSSSQLF